MLSFTSGDGFANQTQTAGTRIQRVLGGGLGFTHLVNLRYTDSGTAHTVTIMRGASGGRGKVVGSVAAGGTSVVVDTALTDGGGNAIAASDIVCVKLDNGTWHISTVSSWTAGTLTIVLTTAVPTGRTILDGAKIVNYGVAGDSMHSTQQYTMGAGSSAVNIPAVAGGVLSLCKASGSNEPLVIDSNNASNAGTINYANIAYSVL